MAGISGPAADVAGIAPASRAPTRAQKEYPSGINNSLEDNNNPPLPPESEHVRVTYENGRLQLHNGLEQFWLGMFGDPEMLDLALIQAAGYVQPNSRKPLEAQVSAQLARKLADKREKDARYEKARKANASDKGRGHSNRMSLDELSDVVDAAYESQFATPKQSAMRLTHER